MDNDKKVLSLQVPRKLQPLLPPMRYKGAYGGRGGCKSHFFAEQVIMRCMQKPTRIVCIREVQASIKDSVKQLLSDKIQFMDVGMHFKEMETEIRGGNGSIIVFKGMQSYTADSIKSLEAFDVAWVEEAQTFSQYSLDLLRPTIRKEGSELWFSWNPRFKTDPVDMFFRKTPPEDSISVNIGWQDNPWLPEVLRNELEHDYSVDREKADHVWGGGYQISHGAILARWVQAADKQGRINNTVKVDAGGAPIDISCDIGFRDTAAFWYWQRLSGGYNLLMYDADSGLDADSWVPRVQEKLSIIGGKLGKVWLPHDAKAKTFQSRHSTMERFIRGFGVKHIAVVPQTKKGDQISAARKVIDSCAFNKERCEKGLDSLSSWTFEWNEDSGTFSREPLHNQWSHGSDAFAYGCQVMEMMTVEKPKPKTEFKTLAQLTFNELWDMNKIPKHKRI